MTGITHGQSKIALNSTSSFAVRVECAKETGRYEMLRILFLRKGWGEVNQ